jgi:hypothetical protein
VVIVIVVVMVVAKARMPPVAPARARSAIMEMAVFDMKCLVRLERHK